jgi:hypothetical protein
MNTIKLNTIGTPKASGGNSGGGNGGGNGGGTSSSYRGQVWDTLFNPAPVDDGATSLFINITRDDQKSFVVVFLQNKAHGVVIDWGDGTQETKKDAGTYSYCEHTYMSLGRFTIKLTPSDGCTYQLGGGDIYNYTIIGNSSNTGLTYFDALYRVDVGKNVTDIHKAFRGLINLQQVNFLIDDINIGNDSFYGLTRMYHFKSPKRALSVGQRAFFDSTGIGIFDFSEIESVPALISDAFGNIEQYSIIVPDSLYDEFISATNWSNRASYIVRLSDFIK